jgi:hypothetical protein
VAAGAVTLALRALFERPAFELDVGLAVPLLQSAIATALCGPPIVMAAQRITGAPAGAERAT